MRELAERLITAARDLFGYRGALVQRAAPEAAYLVDNPNRRSPNIDKSRRELGYNPGIDIDEGLRRTLIWYHHNQEADEA
jgi:dTDP-glucose 4,6-dehydratase/UDP-glucuronate decarboxylase